MLVPLCSFLWHPQGVLVRNFVSYPGTLEPGTRAWRESVTTYRSYGTGRVGYHAEHTTSRMPNALLEHAH